MWNFVASPPPRQKIQIDKMELVSQCGLGETHPRKNRVNLGIAQKGGGGRNACPNCLWQFFSEYEPFLSHLIFIIIYQYLPRFPSEYHLRIIFDLSHCQNIHSQSQNCCLKNFLIFGKIVVPQSARICAIGGVKLQFGQCPNIHVFLGWGFPK